MVTRGRPSTAAAGVIITSYPSLSEVGRDPHGEPAVLPHVSRRYVITVSSGLISPDEVAAIYRRARNRDYGLPTERSGRQTVWSAELVRFVDYERQKHRGESPASGRHCTNAGTRPTPIPLQERTSHALELPAGRIAAQGEQTRGRSRTMRGSIRQRGGTWELNADVGKAEAQRCATCNKRTFVERRPLEHCPRCGGEELVETVERRRVIQGGFATRREAQAALNKILTAVQARTYVPPSHVTVKQFLLGEWLPTVKGTLRPTTYASYKMLAESTSSRASARSSCRSSRQAPSTLFTRTSQNTAACAARVRSRPPRYAACTPCCTAPVTTPCAGDASPSTRSMPPTRRR